MARGPLTGTRREQNRLTEPHGTGSAASQTFSAQAAPTRSALSNFSYAAHPYGSADPHLRSRAVNKAGTQRRKHTAVNTRARPHDWRQITQERVFRDPIVISGGGEDLTDTQRPPRDAGRAGRGTPSSNWGPRGWAYVVLAVAAVIRAGRASPASAAWPARPRGHRASAAVIRPGRSQACFLPGGV